MSAHLCHTVKSPPPPRSNAVESSSPGQPGKAVLGLFIWKHNNLHETSTSGVTYKRRDESLMPRGPWPLVDLGL